MYSRTGMYILCNILFLSLCQHTDCGLQLTLWLTATHADGGGQNDGGGGISAGLVLVLSSAFVHKSGLVFVG